jgi:putative addiction module CopG family antidote
MPVVEKNKCKGDWGTRQAFMDPTDLRKNPPAWKSDAPCKSIHPIVVRLVSWNQRESTECKAMNINLTPEQEKIVKDELKSGHFQSVEEVIGEALQVLREKEQSSSVRAPNGAEREAVREMLEFVEKNRVRLEGVSVKELIHEGHRL